MEKLSCLSGMIDGDGRTGPPPADCQRIKALQGVSLSTLSSPSLQLANTEMARRYLFPLSIPISFAPFPPTKRCAFPTCYPPRDVSRRTRGNSSSTPSVPVHEVKFETSERVGAKKESANVRDVCISKKIWTDDGWSGNGRRAT